VLALSNLFDDYKDSPDSTYIETAAVPLVLAALLLVAGALTLRKRPS
jgi:MprA protease rhombosortase-interaction domain-containing protein